MKRSAIKPGAPMKRTAPLRRDAGEARLTVPVFRSKGCKVCRAKFTPTRRIQPVCAEVSCAITYAEGLLAAKKARAALDQRRAAKEDRKVTREKLAKLKTRGDWLREAQAAFNAWVRARDAAAGLPCISCDRHDKESWDAGHYLTVGARPELRFHEANCHRQCVQCNQHLHGNLVLYRMGLVRRIGAAAVEALEGSHEPLKLTVPDLQALKSTYAAKARELRRAAV